jgi:hypothetical protein
VARAADAANVASSAGVQAATGGGENEKILHDRGD